MGGENERGVRFKEDTRYNDRDAGARESQAHHSSSQPAHQHHEPAHQHHGHHGHHQHHSSSGSSENWAVPSRYQLIKVIGSGSYGKVCQAYDKETKRNVAIKKIKRIFEDLIDCKRLLREIAILSSLNDDRVVKLYDVCVPEDPMNFTELYLVLELCDSDFKKLFKLPEFLTECHIITLLFNTLCGLKYIHSAGIYHRDLKPANCLVNRDCAVKVCDFGLSRPVGQPGADGHFKEDPEDQEGSRNPKRTLTGHVVTRWYRAPELILLQENYTEQIDMWSLGCIFAELLGMIRDNFPNPKERCPLFQGSTCYPLSPHKEHDKEYTYYYNRQSRDQLNVIFNILGTPSDEVVEKLDKQDAKRYVRCFKSRPAIPLEALDRFRNSSPEAIDLLAQMLVLDNEDRITVDQALEHALFKDVYSRDKIKVAREKIVLDFESEELDEDKLRKYFLREIQKFHPEMRIPQSLQ